MFLFDIHNNVVCRFLKLFLYAFLKCKILNLDGTPAILFFLLLVMIF